MPTASTTKTATAPPRGGGRKPLEPTAAAAPSLSSAPAGAPASPQRSTPGAAAIIADLEAGHEPLTFNRALREKCLWARGRPPHIQLLYRAIEPTKPNPLECALINDVYVTSRPALLRWLARNSHGSNPVAPVPVQAPKLEQRRREQTEARLDVIGLK